MKAIDKMDHVLAALGCICLFSVMWIVGVDAVGRNTSCGRRMMLV